MSFKISNASQKSLTTLMVIWFAMVGALFVYVLVCYMLLSQGAINVLYSPEILRSTFFLHINLLVWAYLVGGVVLGAGIFHFKRAYTKMAREVLAQTFEREEEAFNTFKSRYVSLMFVHLALFESIAILGIVVFLTTGDFTTMVNLTLFALAGFLVVIPSRAKFTYFKG
ncbi:MAG: hypothetical protein EOL93_03015 [Epsilonproteobacteria bacterium]|nr:hypothetical protein [Campylobacterota bacterium]